LSGDQPLLGTVVVEIGHSIAAPYAGLILADLGATVIKVENPAGGDYARGWGPPFHDGASTTYLALNRGKQGITVDFSDEEDRTRLRELILTRADVVIQNLRPGLLQKFDLAPEPLLASKPGLIWADIGAFGSRGPFANKPGYDPLAQATSGIMSVTGEPGRPPVRVGVSLVDMGSGMWAVIGILTALLRRTTDGKGGRIETSLFETGLAWMTVHLSAYAKSGEVRLPFGSGLVDIVPYQAFETADARLMIAAGNDGLFRKFCASFEELAGFDNDPRFATNPDRVVNRDALIERISTVLKTYAAAEVARRLDAANVPNCPILAVDQVQEHPQTAATGMSFEVGGLRLMGIPLCFDGTRPAALSPAPGLGADDYRFRNEGRDV
jgi:crotonobetainyl-CoA:carnitine CoA-transferase CaiB-like acyl-CoA transferase